jgi:hypothetical protein
MPEMISKSQSDRYAMMLVIAGASIVWCGVIWVAATSLLR